MVPLNVIPDPTAALRAMHPRLAEGGFVAVSVWDHAGRMQCAFAVATSSRPPPERQGASAQVRTSRAAVVWAAGTGSASGDRLSGGR